MLNIFYFIFYLFLYLFKSITLQLIFSLAFEALEWARKPFHLCLRRPSSSLLFLLLLFLLLLLSSTTPSSCNQFTSFHFTCVLISFRLFSLTSPPLIPLPLTTSTLTSSFWLSYTFLNQVLVACIINIYITWLLACSLIHWYEEVLYVWKACFIENIWVLDKIYTTDS